MGTNLIVEDDRDIAELVKFHLEKAGLSDWAVSDGKYALDLILQNHPDLVILNLMLPGMDGLEVCRRLRGNATTERIPILMLTAKTDEVDRIVGLEMGRTITSGNHLVPVSWSRVSWRSFAGPLPLSRMTRSR